MHSPVHYKNLTYVNTHIHLNQDKFREIMLTCTKIMFISDAEVYIKISTRNIENRQCIRMFMLEISSTVNIKGKIKRKYC